MVLYGVGLVVEGFDFVVAGRFGQFEALKNVALFGGQAGALGDGEGDPIVGPGAMRLSVGS
jgi:hypothetical protein